MKKKLLCLSLFLCLGVVSSFAKGQYDENKAVGFASGVTGGNGQNEVTVTTASALEGAISGTESKTVYVDGTITLNGMLNVGSNKTIIGLPGAKIQNLNQNENAGIFKLNGSNNVIIRNLVFEGPGAYDMDGNDNLTLQGATNIWIDHCDIQDGMDCNMDIVNGSDNISITWTRFRYLKAPTAGGSGGSADHRYNGLIGNSDTKTTDDGKLNVTFSNCWWDEGCKERCPRVRFGKVHLVNCLYSGTVFNYCIGYGAYANIYAENCAFTSSAAQQHYVKAYNNGYDYNITVTNCSGVSNFESHQGSRGQFVPSYEYGKYSESLVESVVSNETNGAGATLSSEDIYDEHLYIIGVGGVWDMTNMPEMTWNNTNQVFTYDINSDDIIYFAIATQQMETENWDVFNANYRYAIGANNQNATVDTPYNLQKVNGSVVLPAGKYTVSVTKEMVMTITSNDTPVTYPSWNFSDLEAGDYTSNTDFNGMTIYATSDKKVSVDNSSKTFDEVAYTKRLKLGGTGASDSRMISFPVTGPATIKIHFAHASNSGDPRTLKLDAGTFGTNVASQQVTAGGTATLTYDYTGTEEQTFYAYSASSGLNLYAVIVSEYVAPDTYIVAGQTAIVNGDVAWDGTIEANKMTTTDKENYTLTVSNLKLAAGTYEYKIVKNGLIWIPDGVDNNLQVIIPEYGIYNITYTYKVTGNEISAEATQVAKLYAETVSAGEYATRFFAEGVSLWEADADVKFYVVTAVTGESVTLLEVTTKKVPANTPFLIYNEAAEAKSIDLAATNDAEAIAGTLAEQFKGTNAEKQFEVSETLDYYVCNGTNFVFVKDAGTLSAHRCWIELSKNAAAKSLNIVVNDEATGIHNSQVIMHNNDVRYNLAGQRVSNDYKGIVIINGKKVKK